MQNYYYPPFSPLDMGQYKTPYQPMPQYQMPPAQPAKTGSELIWVQGEAAAKAYLVAPGNTLTLWDSESPTIYIKSADASGIPSMRVLDFVERTEPAPHKCQCTDKWATKEQVEELKAEIEKLKGRENNG
jgi:hypothetical protein